MVKSVIIGTGSYLPEKVLTNSDLEKIVETTDEWITARTGIKQRHIAADNESTVDMAFKASSMAIEAAGIDKDDIDLIVVATTTPDKTFPSCAVLLQAKLGVTQGAAFDVQAVCSGFVYAMSVADNAIKAGQAKNVLVVGAEKMSSIVDWQDRATCILFGDGAGAVILQGKESSESGIMSTHIYSDGRYSDILYVDGGVCTDGNGKIKMLGQEVFKHAVDKMSDCVLKALEHNGLKVGDIDLLVPHQANIRILKSVAKKLKLQKDKVIIKVENHANTSAASIGLALDAAVKENRVKKGDLVVLEALGGGLTWGSCVLRW